MKTTLRRTAWTLALAAAAGCKKDDAIDRVQQEVDAGPDKDPVQLAVTVAKPAVTLGDDIVFHFKLTNAGAAKVQVNVPRLDQRSASLRVRQPDGGVAIVTRIHAEMAPTGQMKYEPLDVKDLAPAESLEADVSSVAVESGKIAFTPMYVRQGAPAALVAPTIEVTVTPADAARPRLGVQLDTTHGSYTAVLRPDVAYNTVESFATLVKKDFYKGVKLHRIVRGFMAQGGDPKGTGEGGPGYFLPIEANLKLRHKRGIMSMARTPLPDSAGSQFFIMFAANSSLDPVPGRPGGEGYTIFAEMTDGEQTLKKLESVPVGPSMQGEMSVPKELVQIQTARLVTLP